MHQLYDKISKVLICTYTENHVNMSVVKSIKKIKIIATFTLDVKVKQELKQNKIRAVTQVQ